MKYVFVFAVLLVLLGIAASFNGRYLSPRSNVQRLQNAKSEDLLARRFHAMKRGDDSSDFDCDDFSSDSNDMDRMTDRKKKRRCFTSPDFQQLGKRSVEFKPRNTSVVRSLLAAIKKLTKK